MHKDCVYSSTLNLGRDFSELPKGTMMRLAMNPYNGNIVCSLQGGYMVYEIVGEIVRDMADKLGQLDGMLGRRADFEDLCALMDGDIEYDDFKKCPFCGMKPYYDDESHEITCCGGHAKYYDFSDRDDAVAFWNMRSRMVA